MDSKLLEELAKTLAAALPPGLREMQQDLEKNFRAVLQAFFARLDLVTREEFEVQRAVLERTRELVERLDAKLTELEAKRPAGGAAAGEKKPRAVKGPRPKSS